MKIGILGGTFDPPHYGHIHLAEEAQLRLGLERVFFVPAMQSPLRSSKESAAPVFRYEMTRLAVRNHPAFEVSDVELKREPPSYTVDTLREFRTRFPYPHEIFFLAGADVLGSLSRWKDLSIILEMCQFVVATRPGFLIKNVPEGVTCLEIDEQDIAAKAIRERIRLGEPVNDWVPHKVLEFIKKEGLYR